MGSCECYRASIEKVEAALRSAFDIRFVFNKWTLGAETLSGALKIPAERYDAPGFDLLSALGFTRAEIEAHLRSYLGVETVIWIPRGVWNDETDGHVDNLACFSRPGRVLLTWTEEPGDPQAGISAEARAVLESATDARGRRLEVGLLPAPGPLTVTAEEAAGVDAAEHAKPRTAGERMAGSYVNFLITNDSVVHPRLDERTDDEAAARLAEEFPGRRIDGVPGREILLGGGNVHCITQQVPAGG